MDHSAKPRTGDQAPNSRVTVTEGSVHSLSELAGPKGLIIYFYPKDNTPGCTREACDFRDRRNELDRLGYGVVGVSADSVQSHQRFSESQSLNFPLIADEQHSLIKKFGAFGEKKMYGRSFDGILRTTFVLDKTLNVQKVYDAVKVEGHVNHLIDDIKNHRLGGAAPSRKKQTSAAAIGGARKKGASSAKSALRKPASAAKKTSKKKAAKKSTTRKR
ncbi:MAG: peroxiredoxin [Leptospirales bacterium]|nr:peroxiredoxin [Leptospirales bacterium]